METTLEQQPLQNPTVDHLHPAWAMVIVFLSNFCILVIELVAARLMAPVVGVSLYTWTSIIGVILAGISLGNYLGGKIADRYASRNTLALFFVLSGLTSASILFMIDMVQPLFQLNLPIVINILLVFTAIFLLPATILGIISPIVVKLTLNDLNETGNVVGKISAAGTAGSIAGAFVTGFFLISTFGTRSVLWGIAGCLILIGAIIALSSKSRGRYSALIILMLFLGGSAYLWQQGWLASKCTRETNYFCIKVRIDSTDNNVRVLTLDRLVHSYVYLDDPTRLRYGYEQLYADVLEGVFPADNTISSLFIGGGGYTFPRYIESVRPQSEIEVIEIDPEVTDVAYIHLGLNRNSSIISYNEDARQYINRLPPAKKYNLIVGDAFNDFSVPYHLTTLEFNQLIKSHLAEQGIYMVNIIDGRYGYFSRAYIKTLQNVFPYVYVAPTGGNLGELTRQTIVVVASHKPLKPEELGPHFMPLNDLADYIAAESAPVLTDDYVPVDNLLAPVFEDEGL